MRYTLRQNLITLRDSYEIKDERGRVAFIVKSKYVSIGKKFWICDANGREIVYMKQNIFHLYPHYKVEIKGAEVATVKSCFSPGYKKMKATSSVFGTVVATGKLLGWTFTYKRDGQEIAKTSKNILRIADTYTIDIADAEKNYYILALAVISDAIFQPKK